MWGSQIVDLEVVSGHKPRQQDFDNRTHTKAQEDGNPFRVAIGTKVMLASRVAANRESVISDFKGPGIWPQYKAPLEIL